MYPQKENDSMDVSSLLFKRYNCPYFMP